MQRGAPLWGPLAVSVLLQIRISSLLLFSLPHPSAKKAQKHKDTKAGVGPTPRPGPASTGMPLAGCFPPSLLPSRLPHLKTTPLGHLWSPSQSSFIFKVYVQGFGIMCVIPGTGKVSCKCLQEDRKKLAWEKSLLHGPMDHRCALVEGGRDGADGMSSPRQDWEFARPSNRHSSPLETL